MNKLSVCIVRFREIHRSSMRKIEQILNRPITKFYTSDDVNATTVELRQTKARLIFFLIIIDNLCMKQKCYVEMSKIDVFLWVSVKCVHFKTFFFKLRNSDVQTPKDSRLFWLLQRNYTHGKAR